MPLSFISIMPFQTFIAHADEAASPHFMPHSERFQLDDDKRLISFGILLQCTGATGRLSKAGRKREDLLHVSTSREIPFSHVIR